MNELSVTIDLGLDDEFRAVLSFDDDFSRTLDAEDAHAYVAALFVACEQAEHDAAVVGQFRNKLTMDAPTTAQFVNELRRLRPALDHHATRPLLFLPGVSAANGKPFIDVHHHGKQIGQWDIDVARDHALHVLRTVYCAPLDTAYRNYLIGQVHIEPGRANHMLMDLAEHRGSL